MEEAGISVNKTFKSRQSTIKKDKEHKVYKPGFIKDQRKRDLHD